MHFFFAHGPATLRLYLFRLFLLFHHYSPCMLLKMNWPKTRSGKTRLSMCVLLSIKKKKEKEKCAWSVWPVDPEHYSTTVTFTAVVLKVSFIMVLCLFSGCCCCCFPDGVEDWVIAVSVICSVLLVVIILVLIRVFVGRRWVVTNKYTSPLLQSQKFSYAWKFRTLTFVNFRALYIFVQWGWVPIHLYTCIFLVCD